MRLDETGNPASTITQGGDEAEGWEGLIYGQWLLTQACLV